MLDGARGALRDAAATAAASPEPVDDADATVFLSTHGSAPGDTTSELTASIYVVSPAPWSDTVTVETETGTDNALVPPR